MRADSVGIAKQAAVGTKQTTMEYFVPVESATVGLNRETQTVEESVGHRYPTDLDYGTQHWEGSLTGKPRYSSFGRVLSGFFGAPTTTTTAFAGAKLHTFATGTLPQVHSILVNRTDPSPAITDLIYDAYGNGLTLTAAVNDWLSMEAGYIAKSNDDTQSEPTVTLDTSPRINFDELTAAFVVNGGSSNPLTISNFSLSYSNNYETDNFVLGSRNLYALNEGNATADVSFTVKSGLADEYRRALLADPDNVKIVLTGTGALIGGGVNYSMVLTVFKCQYISAPANVSAADRLTGIEVSARAAYDTSTSKFIDIALTNTVTAY